MDSAESRIIVSAHQAKDPNNIAVSASEQYGNTSATLQQPSRSISKQ